MGVALGAAGHHHRAQAPVRGPDGAASTRRRPPRGPLGRVHLVDPVEDGQDPAVGDQSGGFSFTHPVHGVHLPGQPVVEPGRDLLDGHPCERGSAGGVERRGAHPHRHPPRPARIDRTGRGVTVGMEEVGGDVAGQRDGQTVLPAPSGPCTTSRPWRSSR